MCKVLAVIGFKSDPKKLDMFLKNASVQLTSRSDNDGFGYAGVGPQGMFGERWLNVDDAFRFHPDPFQDAKVMKELQDTIELPSENYNSFGTIDINNSTSLLLHARMSTNSISMKNTHPFVENETALIHNGVVHSQVVKNETSTCDSELILRAFLKADVTNDPVNLQGAVDLLNGYWACAVLSRKDGQWIVDVFKDSKAELSYAEISELGNAKVYCTAADMLQRICKASGFKVPRIYPVKTDTHARFDAVTGKTILTQKLTSTSFYNSWHDWKKNYGYGEGYGNYDGSNYPRGSTTTTATPSSETATNLPMVANSDIGKTVEDSVLRAMSVAEKREYYRKKFNR